MPARWISNDTERKERQAHGSEKQIKMLPKADDFPLHQTAEAKAFSGTDRNFYDRYFFIGMTTDQSLFFAVMAERPALQALHLDSLGLV